MSWRCEVWNLPSASPHEVVIKDLGPVSVDWSYGNSVAGNGSMEIYATYPRLSDVISAPDDVQTLVRCYWDDVLQFAFFPSSVSEPYEDPSGSMVTVSGNGVLSMMGWAVAYMYDYPALPSKTANHIYGGESSTGSFANGGLEDGDYNGDAESGSTEPWKATAVQSGDDIVLFTTPTTFTVQTGQVQAGTYAFACIPNGARSGFQYTFPVVPGESYDFSGLLKEPTASGGRYTMMVKLGEGSTSTAAVFSGYGVDELDAALPGAGASDGTWQSLFQTVVFGPEVTSTTVVFVFDDPGAGLEFFVDQIVFLGPGIGLSPWELTNPDETDVWAIDVFNKRSGDQSMKWQANVTAALGGVGVRQKLTGLIVGKTYTWSAYFQHDGGGNEPVRLVAYRVSAGSFLSSDLTQIATGSGWTYASTTFVADANEIWIDFRYDDTGGSPLMRMDDGVFAEGLAKATIGAIVQDLMDDATTDHVAEVSPGAPRNTLAFLKYDGFSGTVDNDSIAWDQTLSLVVPFGQSYLQMLGQAGGYGYESEMVWNSGASEWELKLYNSGALGTNYDAAATPSVQEGMGITSGQLSQIVRSANRALGVGAAGVWEEANDAASETALSRREAFVGDLDILDSASIGSKASEALLSFERTAAGFKLTFHEAAQVLPGRDFLVGDTILVQLPSFGIDSAFRVATVGASWGKVGESTYTADFGEEVVLAGAASSVYLDKLLSRFEPLREAEETAFSAFAGAGSAGPIEPSFLVASSTATPAMRAVADFVCDGVADQAEIQAAVDALPALGGRIQLTEGIYEIEISSSLTTGQAEIIMPANTSLVGLGAGTILNMVNPDTTSRHGIDIGANCQILDLTVDVTDTAANLQAIYFADSPNGLYSTVARCWFDGMFASGVGGLTYISLDYAGLVEGNVFLDIGEVGG